MESKNKRKIWLAITISDRKKSFKKKKVCLKETI